MSLDKGCVVLATAGKEKGRAMAVVGSDNRFVLLADGRKRPIERPKRKNPRHIKSADFRLDISTLSSNRELRRALADSRCLLTDK